MRQPGLPNKNKCEEILNASDLLSAQDAVAICVFDLNNLRNINNNLGHDKGDEYIRSFAVQLRIAVADEYFVGRDGDDEFVAVIKKSLVCRWKNVLEIFGNRRQNIQRNTQKCQQLCSLVSNVAGF